MQYHAVYHGSAVVSLNLIGKYSILVIEHGTAHVLVRWQVNIAINMTGRCRRDSEYLLSYDYIMQGINMTLV